MWHVDTVCFIAAANVQLTEYLSDTSSLRGDAQTTAAENKILMQTVLFPPLPTRMYTQTSPFSCQHPPHEARRGGSAEVGESAELKWSEPGSFSEAAAPQQ